MRGPSAGRIIEVFAELTEYQWDVLLLKETIRNIREEHMGSQRRTSFQRVRTREIAAIILQQHWRPHLVRCVPANERLACVDVTKNKADLHFITV